MRCHPLFQGAFPAQGWNLGLLLRRRILYCLSHQGRFKWLLWGLNKSITQHSAWYRTDGPGRVLAIVVISFGYLVSLSLSTAPFMDDLVEWGHMQCPRRLVMCHVMCHVKGHEVDFSYLKMSYSCLISTYSNIYFPSAPSSAPFSPFIFFSFFLSNRDKEGGKEGVSPFLIPKVTLTLHLCWGNQPVYLRED